MSRRLSHRTLLSMALRANLLQATWNFERQQGIGWAFALHPALKELYPDAAKRCERLAEHTAYFNTQPTLASLALGAVAQLEEQRTMGSGPDAAPMGRIKNVLGSTLAALGDRLFWLSLRPFAAALAVLVAVTRPASPLAAMVLWTTYALPHLWVRFSGVAWGYREGPSVLTGVLRSRLEIAVTLLAYAGCIVIGVLVAWGLVPGGIPMSIAVQSALAAGLGLGLITAQRARPSPTQWALGLGILGVVAIWLR
ncbi:MAG: PTS system mannose/fructose/sorbose family transporter subunit IID [Candidatus Eisenbacteria bacterium]